MTSKDSKEYRQMIEKALKDYEGQIDELVFYIEVKEMYDKQGRTRSEEFPYLAINFK